jgi:methyl-accepting chemotaxis protein
MKMKRFNDFKIGTRLNVVSNTTFVVIFAFLGIYTMISQRKQFESNSDTRMYEQVNDLAVIINEQVLQSQKNTEIALNVFDNLVSEKGRLNTSSSYVTIDAINQETQTASRVQLKRVTLAGESLYNNSLLVDKVTELTGVVSSILQKIPEGYVRIATTVKKDDATRAVNTYIPNSSPVARALDKGESYFGRAIVMGEWHHTAYKPYKLNDGSIIVLFTGFPEKNLQSLKELFSSKKYFETGYSYLITKAGDFVIHPNKEGSNEKDSEFFKQILADDDGYGKSAYMWEGKEKFQYFKYLPSIDSYVAATVYRDSISKAINEEDKSTRNSLIIAVIFGVGLFIVINFLISRSITNGLKKGIEFTKKVAQGDLTVDLNIDQKDEIGEMASALSQMLVKLKEIVFSIIEGAENIDLASSEISNNSQQLSQGASELAASTEEISSSMEQMASNIQQNNENAQQTERISGSATESMLEMSKIGRESFDSIKTIAEKITIINDIAFQTNLLALNAAVEAARAGEHGRGFAVVAAEVRKLAERSKLAADEIGVLSKNSLMITEKTRQSLETLVPEIQKTAHLVKEISSACLEQNSGANQINVTLQQLNIVTQQNATSSEEMASSAEELSNQADSLKEVVSYFKIMRSDRTSTRRKPGFTNKESQDKGNGRANNEKDKIAISKSPIAVEASDSDFENFKR